MLVTIPKQNYLESFLKIQKLAQSQEILIHEVWVEPSNLYFLKALQVIHIQSYVNQNLVTTELKWPWAHALQNKKQILVP